MAGGRGERLKPITDTRPKPLVNIAGKTLVQRIMEAGAGLGIKSYVVVTGYLGDLVERHARRVAEGLGVEVDFVRQSPERGSGDALLRAAHAVRGESIVVYGDLLVDGEAIRRVAEASGAAIAGVPHPEPWMYGVILGSSGEAVRIVEKPSPSEVPGDALVNAGIYKLDPDMISLAEKIQESPRGEVELTDLVGILSERGVRPKIVRIEPSSWMDIGRPWDVLEATKRVLESMEGQVVRGRVEEGAKLLGPVYVGDKAEVRSGTRVEGPAYIDEGAEIGPNAYIRPNTYVGRGARIGFSVEIKASVIYEGARIPHLSYVGDSVVCENTNLGAGTIVANFRFDEQPVKVTVKGERVSSGRTKLGAFIGGHVKTGVNSSILPGVRVGAFSIIYPGVVVARDVEYGSVVKRSMIE